jgi:uncharacterized membrane-anchored protein
MASTFLARLRVGEILMDAKGVSRVYRGLRPRDVWLLVGAAAVLLAVVVIVSPGLRLEIQLLWQSFREFLFHARHGG